jgi:hypothetical protein
VGVLLVEACGGGEDTASEKGAAPTSQQISIRTSLAIAATSGAEPIATGEVLDGSTLGGSPVCVGGAIRDSQDPNALAHETLTGTVAR